MSFLGLFTFTASYLPWVLLGFSVLLTSTAKDINMFFKAVCGELCVVHVSLCLAFLVRFLQLEPSMPFTPSVMEVARSCLYGYNGTTPDLKQHEACRSTSEPCVIGFSVNLLSIPSSSTDSKCYSQISSLETHSTHSENQIRVKFEAVEFEASISCPTYLLYGEIDTGRKQRKRTTLAAGTLDETGVEQDRREEMEEAT
ncbi:hypothetical protein Rs2_17046 [Raphanus sativus]|nr:hypothetical protein Rs2_17046 [Raphanus sativus]